jgi:predicted Zn-dependent peptidase
MWGKDSISFPILGSIDTVKSFTQEDLIEYISSYYIPENSVISVAGNVDLNNVEKLIEKYFGTWNTLNEKVTDYSKPEFLNNHFFKKKNIEQLHLSLGIPGVENGSSDLYTLLILNNMYGGMASSILFQKIREERGLCYSIYSYITSFNNVGAVVVYAGLNAKYAYDVIARIKEEMLKFSSSIITEDRLKKSKEQLKGNYILGLESISSRMFNNGKSLLLLNRLNIPEDIIEKINNIDKESIERVMKNTFYRGIANSSFVGKKIDIPIIEDLLEKDSISFKKSKKNLI